MFSPIRTALVPCGRDRSAVSRSSLPLTWIRSAATFLFLVFGVGCATPRSFNGLGVEVTNPLDGSGKISGVQDGVRVEGEGIGWTRDMVPTRVTKTFVTLRIHNGGPRRLLLRKEDILLGDRDYLNAGGHFPYQMVRWPGGVKEEKIALDPGQDAGLRMAFVIISISRNRDVVMRLSFKVDDPKNHAQVNWVHRIVRWYLRPWRENENKNRVQVMIPIYLKEAPLRDPQEYHDYLKPSHPDFPRATPVSGLGPTSNVSHCVSCIFAWLASTSVTIARVQRFSGFMTSEAIRSVS